MSQRALLLAVRDYLRSELRFADAECEVMFDGQPIPMAGELFVAVWPGDWTGNDIEGRDDYFGINITVTRRVTFAPQDRVVVPLAGPDANALDKALESIISKIHMDPPSASAPGINYPVLAKANATINTPNVVNAFVEPLRFLNGGRPEPKGPEWFSALSGSEVSGIAQTLTFGRARRTQTIESQT